jgi:hypothetical protein
MHYVLMIFMMCISLFSNVSHAHTFDGSYLCKESAFSLFRTEVIIKNMKKQFSQGEFKPFAYQADVYFDGKLLSDKIGKNHYLKRDKKERIYIQIMYDMAHATWRNEGVSFVIKEKVFSEESGSKWVRKRDVHCEEK